ncbi:MAG: hypothetical protein LUG21_05030 [Clostridiales bacterium]|nr:hypothetical protein [Clostridiales bacterium]
MENEFKKRRVIHDDTVLDYDEENDMLIVCRQNAIERCDKCGKLFPKIKAQTINGEYLCPFCNASRLSKVQCNYCKDILTNEIHGYQTCSCGKISFDTSDTSSIKM